MLIEHGRGLTLAGAEGLVNCSGAFNPIAENVRRALGIPVIDFGLSIRPDVYGKNVVDLDSLAEVVDLSQRAAPSVRTMPQESMN